MASEDVGGLNYKVEVVYDPEPLNKAVQGINAAINEFSKLAKIQTVSAQSQLASAKALNELAEGHKAVARAAAEESSAEKSTNKQLDIQKEARKKIVAELRKQAVLQAIAVEDSERGFSLARQEISQTRAKFEALKKIAVVNNKRLISEQALIEVGDRVNKLTAKELRSIGILDEKTLELAASRDRLRKEEIISDPEIQRLKAEAAALREVNKESQEAANRKAFGAKGLLTPAQKKEQEATLREQALAQERIFRKTFGEEVTRQSELVNIQKERAEIERLSADKNLLSLRAQAAVEREKLAIVEQRALEEARLRAGLVPPGSGGGGGVTGGGRGKNPANENNKLNKSLKETQSLGNRIAFTFRRLFGILAAFTVARRLVQAFTASIREAIQFNARLEQIRLGIASIFLASGQITDAFSGAKTGAEGLALAQKEALRQTNLLKLEAVRTAATFEELSEAFQTAIAPGLRAGLNLDSIRELTVRISQAAAALGVPQTQLAEEIRSLLQGTIRVRDTRIAVALGITNADIKRAKELGVLAEFLQERFAAFGVAGVEAEKTFTVAFSNLKDALSLLSGETGLNFFNELKGLIFDIRDSIVEINRETGRLNFNRDAINAATVFFNILQSAAEQTRLLGANLDTKELQNIGLTIERTANVAFSSLRVTIELLVSGLSTASTIFQGIFTIIKDIGDAFRAIIPETIINAFSGLAGDTLKWVIALKAVAVGIGLVVSVSKKLSIFLVGPILRLIRFIFPGLIAGFRELAFVISILTAGLNLNLLSLAPFIGALGAAATAAFLAAAAIKAFNEEAVPHESEIRRFKELQEELTRLKENLSPDSEAGEFLDFESLATALQRVQELEEEIPKLQEELNKLGINPDDFEFKGFLERTKDEAAAQFKDLSDRITEVFTKAGKDSTKATDPLTRAFEESVAAITSGTQELANQQELLEDLRDTAKEAERFLALTADSLNASNEAVSQRLETVQAQLDIEKETKQLAGDRKVEEQRLLDVLNREVALRERINALSENERRTVSLIRGGRVALEELRSKEAELQSKKILLEQELRSVEILKKQDEVERLQKELTTLNENIEVQQLNAGKAREIIEQRVKDSIGGEAQLRDELVDLALEQFRLESERLGVETSIERLAEQLLEIEEARLRAARARVQEIAIQEVNRAVQQTKELKSQLETEKALLIARRSSNIDPRAEGLALARAEVRNEQIRLDLIEKEGEATLRQIDKKINEEIPGTKTYLALLFQRAATEKEIDTLLESQRTRLALARQELEKIQDQSERPVSTGITDSITEFTTAALDHYTNTVNLMTGIFEGFVDFASSAFIGIFDPQNTESARQKLGRFFLQIASMAIQMLTRIAIAQAALKLGWVSGAAPGESPDFSSIAEEGGSGGFKEGGKIPGKGNYRPSLAHLMGAAKGYNKGGAPNSKDTTPIWAQAGEFMMRLRAVKKYGLRVMSAINQGLINPTDLQSLAGTKHFATHSPKRHFQTGGLIGEQLNQLANRAVPIESQRPGNNSPTIGFLVPSESSLEQLLAQGKTGFLRFLQQNSAVLKSIVSQ